MSDVQPTVSVVMSAYNAGLFVAEAVQSILKQTYRDFECIVIDDGSTDDTLAILRAYAGRDDRLRVISRENRGLIASLNEGIALARGEFIARMDADDIALPRRLERQVDRLRQNGEVVALGTGIVLIDPAGRPLMRWHHKLVHEDIVKRLVRGDGSALTHPTVLMRREAVLELGGYDERFEAAEDFDLYLKLSEVGKLENMDEVLLHWRQHPASVNATRSQLWTSKKRLALKEAIDRRGSSSFATALVPQQRANIQEAGPEFWATSALRSGYHRTALYYSWKMIRDRGRRWKGLRLMGRTGRGKLGALIRSLGQPATRG
jgi:glycosyltransferase involved in cell wall biosynthesis